MTTHRRYYFEYPGEWTGREQAWEQIKDVLLHGCRLHWWFNEPTVEGQPFQRLAFSITVSARDQWWCHRRAMELAVRAFGRAGVPSQHVPVPVWEPLAPHMNRGRYRVPQ